MHQGGKKPPAKPSEERKSRKTKARPLVAATKTGSVNDSEDSRLNVSQPRHPL
jgi:hypothetical protein